MVTVDSGEDSGWSKWIDGRLRACGLVHPKDFPELPFTMGLATEALDLIIELPRDYASNRQVDPNNLISLAVKVGDVLGTFRALWNLANAPLNYELIHPATWKGQLPKNVCHDRNLPKLDLTEKTVLQTALGKVPKGKRHDVKDSVCLGLWRLKR